MSSLFKPNGPRTHHHVHRDCGHVRIGGGLRLGIPYVQRCEKKNCEIPREIQEEHTEACIPWTQETTDAYLTGLLNMLKSDTVTATASSAKARVSQSRKTRKPARDSRRVP